MLLTVMHKSFGTNIIIWLLYDQWRQRNLFHVSYNNRYGILKTGAHGIRSMCFLHFWNLHFWYSSPHHTLPHYTLPQNVWMGRIYITQTYDIPYPNTLYPTTAHMNGEKLCYRGNIFEAGDMHTRGPCS